MSLRIRHSNPSCSLRRKIFKSTDQMDGDRYARTEIRRSILVYIFLWSEHIIMNMILVRITLQYFAVLLRRLGHVNVHVVPHLL